MNPPRKFCSERCAEKTHEREYQGPDEPPYTAHVDTGRPYLRGIGQEKEPEYPSFPPYPHRPEFYPTRKHINVGEWGYAEMPHSEVMVHMEVAGKPMWFRVLLSRGKRAYVQLYKTQNVVDFFSSGVGLSEAGVREEAKTGRFYYYPSWYSEAEREESAWRPKEEAYQREVDERRAEYETRHEAWLKRKSGLRGLGAGSTRHDFKVGDRVKYSVEYLRSTGQYTGDICFAKGVVTKIEPWPSSDRTLVSVDWNDPAIPVKVLNMNLAQASAMED